MYDLEKSKHILHYHYCPYCQGLGHFIDEYGEEIFCYHCNGQGKIIDCEEQITVLKDGGQINEIRSFK